MTASSPSPETIRFIARILAAQRTPLAEVADTIAHIARAVGNLDQPMPAPRPAAAPPVLVPEVPVAARPAVKKPRGRPPGRPRRPVAVAPMVEAEPEPEAVPVPQHKLLRRAEIIHSDHDHAGLVPPTRPVGGHVRGVVKWFDGKTGKGALRLTGVSGDVPLERAVLEQAAIKRLYKDQEIEATIEDLGRGRVHLIGVNLPGRLPAAPAAASPFGTGDGSPGARRPARSILVEVKRDSGRATSARQQAEHVFGGGPRTTRMAPSD